MAKLNFFQSSITPVFSVTWSFRNHSNADLLLKKHVLLLSILLKTVVLLNILGGTIIVFLVFLFQQIFCNNVSLYWYFWSMVPFWINVLITLHKNLTNPKLLNSSSESLNILWDLQSNQSQFHTKQKLLDAHEEQNIDAYADAVSSFSTLFHNSLHTFYLW